MNKIDVTVYKINDDTDLYMYTNELCNFIRPIVKYMSKYKVVTRKKIENNVFQSEVCDIWDRVWYGRIADVPFFKIERVIDTCYKLENKDGYYTGDDIYSTDTERFSIQTSDKQLFINFLTESDVWIDESEFVKTQLLEYTKLHDYLIDLIGNYLVD